VPGKVGGRPAEAEAGAQIFAASLATFVPTGRLRKAQKLTMKRGEHSGGDLERKT
jgi:hypothetical protein